MSDDKNDEPEFGEIVAKQRLEGDIVSMCRRDYIAIAPKDLVIKGVDKLEELNSKTVYLNDNTTDELRDIVNKIRSEIHGNFDYDINTDYLLDLLRTLYRPQRSWQFERVVTIYWFQTQCPVLVVGGNLVGILAPVEKAY